MNRHHTRPIDTTVEIDNMMIERYRQMTLAQRVDVMNDLTDMTTKLTVAGITAVHGELSPEGMRWHLCARRYGEDLATEAFGPCPAA